MVHISQLLWWLVNQTSGSYYNKKNITHPGLNPGVGYDTIQKFVKVPGVKDGIREECFSTTK
jgi:hypothetical protein